MEKMTAHQIPDAHEVPQARILVADGRLPDLAAVSSMLDPLGEIVLRANSGTEALRCLQRQDVAVLLLDVQMPDIDGYALASLIRQRERSRHTPIIFMTAYDGDAESQRRGYALGGVDHIFKPIDPMVLRAKISIFVELYKKTEILRRQTELGRRLQTENLRIRTEKIEAERALREVAERQALIARSLSIAFYSSDLSGNFSGPRFLSERLAELAGFDAAEFAEDFDLWPSRIHPDDLRRVLSEIAEIEAKGTASIEYRWRCADGSERIFLDSAVLLHDESGRPREIAGTCLDVTERRHLERQLVQAQKLEAIGLLSGGIAHDFNNMLSVIIWNLDPVARALRDSGKNHERIQNAMSAALSCTELIRQLLTFARHQPHQPKVLDLVEVVKRMSRLCASILGERIEIEITHSDEIWAIHADQAQIESALLNLAINAKDAMPQGGRLTFSLTNLARGHGHSDLDDADYVELAVIDTGAGMAPEVVSRIFEPFFTTKEPGSGNGLGMSMVYGIVTQSNGHIEIKSTIGQGTEIALFFPRHHAPASDEARTIEQGAEPALKNLRILVVEDNPSVRTLTAARLEELEHRVIEAESGVAALAILRGQEPVDLVFTDVVMPGGVSGIELARRARELRPDLKFVLASGYAAQFLGLSERPGPFLQKPYSDEDLDRALRQAFEG